MTGSMTVDRKSNYIISTDGNMNLEGRMEMNAQEIPVNINSTFNDSIIK
jgi:autotransporter translocation and assembly factor TamB